MNLKGKNLCERRFQISRAQLNFICYTATPGRNHILWCGSSPFMAWNHVVMGMVGVVAAFFFTPPLLRHTMV